MVKPDLHDKALAPMAGMNEIKGVNYTYGVVEGVDAVAKLVKLAKPNDSVTVPYDALIVATGFNLPLLYPRLGTTIEERKAEISNVGNTIKKAGCVVVAGGGPVGLELAGAIRCEYADKKVILLVRKDVLSQWPDAHKQKVSLQLQKMNIEVVSGDCSDAPKQPSLESGTLTVGGRTVSYDAFFPAYSKGPNTEFLEGTGALDASLRLDVNEFLQSKSCKEIFAVGVSNVKEPFIAMPKLEAQWNSTVSNVLALLGGKPMKPHKEGATFMKLPPVVMIGSGPKGYVFIDFAQVPPPVKLCCCCGLGGWPCCPPCWPCCACAGCGCCPCGVCCGAPEGKGPAQLMGKMVFKSADFHFKGLGVGVAPAQQKM